MDITRVIFDTNVYGALINENNYLIIKTRLLNDKSFIIYGFGPIRKELRYIPKSIKFGNKNTRLFLFNIYDNLTKGRELNNTKEVEDLTKKIYLFYKENGGIRNWKIIRNDFLIVACALINNLDIIVTNDKRTMLNDKAIKAYKKVVEEENLRYPLFCNLNKIKIRFN